ncbi:MAG: hypothetical protein HY721_10525 [Planctomycetes bacterium]|nr:hypothetical protein [Planctomycetota bacterium]
MADGVRSRLSAVRRTAGHALKRALKGMPSELLQSSLRERAWLYAITFCKPGPSGAEGGERPRLRIIQQEPISKLNPEMLYRQIQYLVEEGDLAQQREEVETPEKTEERGR